MITPVAIRKNQLLLGHVDRVHKILIDDQASSKTDKIVASISKLVADHVLYLPQLERYHRRPVVLRDHIRIVSIRRYVYQPVGRNPEQLRPFRYDNHLIHWDSSSQI